MTDNYRISYDPQRMNGVTQRVLRIAQEANNLTPMFREVETALNQEGANAFSAQGPGWAPLAESTVRIRGSASPILVRTGALRASLSQSGAPGAIRQISAKRFVFGSSLTTRTGLNLASLHARGTSRMPARRPLDPQKLKARFRVVVAAYLKRIVAAR